jgi:predicted NAD-dependent protein-ADP-ribosyltransferase YbiA (DUF1768 family)
MNSSQTASLHNVPHTEPLSKNTISRIVTSVFGSKYYGFNTDYHIMSISNMMVPTAFNGVKYRSIDHFVNASKARAFGSWDSFARVLQSYVGSTRVVSTNLYTKH